MNKILFCLALVMLACGAPAEDDLLLLLGDLEQPITVRPLGGWRNDLAFPNKGTACTSPTTGVVTQQCVFPNARTVTYQCANNFSAGDKATCESFVDAEVANLNSQYFGWGWSFSRVTSGGLVQFSKGALNGSSLTSILPYVQPSGTISGPMGEPGTNYQGTYHVYSNMQIVVDWDKINVNFTNINQAARVRKQTITVGMAWGAGLGAQSFDATRPNAVAITANTNKVLTHAASDQCRVINFTLNPANEVIVSAGCNQ